MVKKLKLLSLLAAVVLCLTGIAFGQEITGNLEGTITDPQGNVVPGVTVTVTSRGRSEGARQDATIGFNRTVTTDQNGFYRVLQVPPGFYTISTAATSGFGAAQTTDVEVVLGKTTPVNFALQAGNIQAVVTVTADTVAIDPTDNKIQTNITAQVAELLPKGTNFTSLLQVAPAVRNEPLSGGFQIDGSSGSENTFIIDGQEVTNFRTGELNANNNLPFQLVQEVQVKSSGFEAEFGGATGGVINVVTKGGNNEFHGEFGMQFTPSKLRAGFQPASGTTETNANRVLILNPATDAEYIVPSKDRGVNVFPTASLSGPILRDRLWFFTSFTPQSFSVERTINYVNPTTRALNFSETYRRRQVNEYTFARLDAQLFNNLRLSGAFTYNPIRVEGSLPGVTTLFNSVLPSGAFGGSIGTLRGAEFTNQQGGRQNSNNTTGQIVWTPTSKLVLNVRGGHNFLNEKLGSYGVPPVTSNFAVSCSAAAGTTTPPAEAGCARGQSNGVAVLDQLFFDASKRDTFDVDASYLVSNFLGRHQFKGGYQLNRLSNEVNSVRTTQVVLRYGFTIGQYAGRNIASTPGAIGAGLVRRFGTIGDVSSKNEGIFFQDNWQPTSRLSLNLGVRAERENVPSFNANAPDVKFSFTDKIAPRIGAAFDLTGNGRTKLFASYGWFYDRFKYELPRGSFGGDFYRDDFFEIFPGQGAFTSFTPARILRTTTVGPNSIDPPFGACPLTGASTALSRCQIDRRIPSNAGAGLEFGAVDPNIEAFRQSEFTVGAERDLGGGFLMSGRYTRKQVDRAIEDAGFLTTTGGEAYIIGNPGRGLARELAEAAGFLALEPERKYDALEVRLDKRFTRNYYFNVNYTYSRLFGNYSGLASADEDGRVSPNVNRFFDLPFAGFTANGEPDNGRLPTDRPHALKFYGAYTLDWNERFGRGGNNRTEFSSFYTVQSGTPLTTEVDILGIDTIPLFGRGDLGRTEAFTQTDFAISHKYRFGNDGRFTMAFDVNVLNLFNQSKALDQFTLISPFVFDLTEAELGLFSAAERTALNLDNPRAQTAAQAFEAERLGIVRFQRRSTSQGILNLINKEDAVDARYKLPDRFQVGRSIRFGFRLLF